MVYAIMSLSVTRVLPVTTSTATLTLGQSSTFDSANETLTTRYYFNVNPGSVQFSGVSSTGTGSVRTLTRAGGFPNVKVGDDITGADINLGTGTAKVTAINSNGSITVTLTGDATLTTGTGQTFTFDRPALDQTVYLSVTSFSLGLENGRAAVLNKAVTWYSFDGTKYDDTGNIANASATRANTPLPINLDRFLSNLRIPAS